MEKVIFWIIVIGIIIVSIYWIINVKKKGLGFKRWINSIILLWIMIIYFALNPELSMYNLLWLTPAIIIIEYFATAIITGIYNAFRYK